MEGSARYVAAERLSVFFDEIIHFLRAAAETPSLGTQSERVALAAATAELARILHEAGAPAEAGALVLSG